MLFNMGGEIAVGSGTASATTSRIALVLKAISRASALACLERYIQTARQHQPSEYANID
jgi:hypothetical protein